MGMKISKRFTIGPIFLLENLLTISLGIDELYQNNRGCASVSSMINYHLVD